MIKNTSSPATAPTNQLQDQIKEAVDRFDIPQTLLSERAELTAELQIVLAKLYANELKLAAICEQRPRTPAVILQDFAEVETKNLTVLGSWKEMVDEN